ncbi:MAG TPA: globin-coupled sensor protein, partial [Azospirillaceae bacterium]|nr:globin-coupled sensor protein [Azospirillaceae bacterium]
MTREFSASSDLPHTFFRLTDDARAALRDIAPVVMGRIDELLDRFYGHLMQWPIARERLENPQSRERLKQQQRAHWELLFRGDINGDYLAHCAAVGQAHQRIQLPPFWWIGAYSHLLGDMTRLVAGQFRLNGEKRAQALTALISAVMYDMAATMAVYNDAHETATIREKLGSFADNLLTHTVDLAIVINEAATANAGMVNELRAMDKTAQHVAASTEAMVSSVSELSSRSHEVATHARDASQSALHGRDVAGRAVASMAEISEAVSAAAQRVNELSSASERIGDIIASIEAIAKQTNLLALNATIEAARAGEAGKGFAVVASEVKSLSRQTATATEDIRSRIDELRAEMMAIIRTMEDSVRAVSEGQTIIRDVSERMGEVGSLVEHASDGMTDIAAILERQTEASGAVAEGIATMADDATENARSIMRTVNAMQN